MIARVAAAHREAIERLPEGATLILQQVGWDEYEQLLADLAERPDLRVSYDRGRLEVMTPLAEHEAYARFIDDVVRVIADERGLLLEKRGSTTWKRRAIAGGVEADACYYVESASRIIGKRTIDLDVDPPPDIVVEIDITNESTSKHPTYAALGVREIWQYNGVAASFLELADTEYRATSESVSFPGVTPAMLAAALAQSARDGQTAALQSFRHRLRQPRSNGP